MEPTAHRRREGDAIAIGGDYQARAIVSPWKVQRFWHQAKLRLIDRVAPPRPGARLADAGCGSGVVAAHLAVTAGSVFGFDANPAAVSFGNRTYASDRLQFVLGPFERMLEFGPFDQIYCIEVLEHLYEEQGIETLRLFARAARSGATLFVTTPNAHSLWPAIEWALDRAGVVPTLQGAQHLTSFTRTSLARTLGQSGWAIDEIGTFNGPSPFLAGLSWPLALLTERVEFAGRRVLPLNLLYCRASLLKR
jgi:2-polyprenyl-3-methyl-5-hydroxy-6-metoxy-1,4-benzoquinol methylase